MLVKTREITYITSNILCFVHILCLFFLSKRTDSLQSKGRPLVQRLTHDLWYYMLKYYKSGVVEKKKILNNLTLTNIENVFAIKLYTCRLTSWKQY